MDIIVPFSVRKREMSGTVSDEAKKIFAKIKEKPELATAIAARELPNRTTLHKVYATTPGGARRLLFFCRHAPTALAESPQVPERWVLVFYRNKGDPVGDNMSHKNATFESQHERIEGKPQREKRTIYIMLSTHLRRPCRPIRHSCHYRRNPL
jgi:hypothetical protein